MSSSRTLTTSVDATESTGIGLRPLTATTGDHVQSTPTPTQDDAPPASTPPGDEDDRVDYPKGSKFFVIFISLASMLLLAGLDANIVATAIPSITNEFHTISDIGWYSSAYRLSAASLQFAFGKLYKEYVTKKILLLSFAIFLFGSILCAAAQSSKMFVAGRAVTGVGVAGGVCGFFTILAELVPLRQRPFCGSIFGLVEGVSSLAGPVLGGIITQSLGWRWCFWINLPIGGAGLIVMAFFLPLKSKPQTDRKTWRTTFHDLDIVGSLFFIPSLAALFIALNWGGLQYSWNDWRIITAFVFFAILLSAFVVDQIVKGDAAILPFRLLKNRSVIAGVILSMCVSSCLTLWEWYAPTYFQVAHGYSPARSGYMMLPCLVATMVGFTLQGSGTSYFGYYTPFAIVSSILLAVGGGLMTTWSPAAKIAELISYFAIVGFAAGIGFMVPQNSVQTVLPKADVPLGLAVCLFSQNFGPALFVSAAQTIFTNRLAVNLHQLAPNANVSSIENLGFGEIKARYNSVQLEHLATAFSDSISQTWYLALALACSSVVGALLLDWKSVKAKES